MQYYSTSRGRAFNRCRRYHHYQYDLCRRPRIKHEALTIGSLYHDGVEAWLLAHRDGHDDPLRAALDGVRNSAAVGNPDLYMFALAGELIRGYHFRWSEWIKGVKIVSTEEQFEVPLRNPVTGYMSRTWRLTGKIDAVIEILDGPNAGVWIMEHKTASGDIRQGSMYWERLRLDDQVSNYMTGAVALGHDPRGCVYDVAQKPSTRVRKATPHHKRKYKQDGSLYATQREVDETPEYYRQRIRGMIKADGYQMGQIVRLDQELAKHHRDVWQTVRAIREAQNRHEHPRNASACYMYGRQCSYFDVCCGCEDIDNDNRFETTSAHPELDLKR